jgi:hypothetical protein
MRRIVIASTILALVLASGASAHHKQGHAVPPGQLKKQAAPLPAPTPSDDPGLVQAINREDGWRVFVDERYGFTIELPFGMFEIVEKTARGLSLRAPQTEAAIEVYGSHSAAGFDPEQFVDAIVQADRVREVTYTAGGRSWFVLSGFYSGAEAGDAVIFYTKFMFSADGTRLAAFEISFPAREKPRFEEVVERIEDSFTSPRS